MTTWRDATTQVTNYVYFVRAEGVRFLEFLIVGDWVMLLGLDGEIECAMCKLWILYWVTAQGRVCHSGLRLVGFVGWARCCVWRALVYYTLACFSSLPRRERKYKSQRIALQCGMGRCSVTLGKAGVSRLRSWSPKVPPASFLMTLGDMVANHE